MTPPDANTLPASSSDRVKESGSRGHESSSAVVAAASGGSGAINEVGLVQLARVALRLGTPLRSLEYSSRARDAYPNGMLGEERDTLMIEALVLVGRRAEALEIERAFEAQYPNSIHLGRVRALVNSAQRFR